MNLAFQEDTDPQTYTVATVQIDTMRKTALESTMVLVIWGINNMKESGQGWTKRQLKREITTVIMIIEETKVVIWWDWHRIPESLRWGTDMQRRMTNPIAQMADTTRRHSRGFNISEITKAQVRAPITVAQRTSTIQSQTQKAKEALATRATILINLSLVLTN